MISLLQYELGTEESWFVIILGCSGTAYCCSDGRSAAAGTYDLLLLTLSRNGEITDDEWEALSINPKAVQDMRDFAFLHQEQKEPAIK